ETDLFYAMAPNRTIASCQIEGSKKACTRITTAFTANANGTHKLQLFFIGHAKKPRCFKKKTGEELGESNCHILLILDNTPSHVTGAFTLTNRAIDCDEAGEHDIYEVDQLQAMRWTKVAWGEVSTKTIKNCWFYTKIISPCNDNGTPITPTFVNNNKAINKYLPIDPNDAKKLQQVINTLCVHNPMSLEDLLKAEEHEELH
ncbi:16636_t:CDS:2, partial [Dentiscutata heterogama]